MNNLLCVILYTMFEFLNFTCCYKIIFNAKFRNQKWIYIITCVIVCIAQIIVIKYVDYSWIDIINFIFGLFIPLLWIDKIKIKDILYYPIIVFGTSIINSCTMFLFSILLNISVIEAMKLPLLVLLSESTAILIMIIYYLLIIRRENSVKNFDFTYVQFITVFVGMLCSGTIIACTQWSIQDGNIPENVKTICGLAVSFVSVIFILVSVWQGVVIIKKAEYKKQNAEYENYLKLQEEHIKMLIDKDESLRRFRHDIHAHMIALKAYAEETNDIELKNYINNIIENSQAFAVKKYTGHSAIDAVITELFIEAEKKKISVKWEGQITINKDITIYDLCVIFSNLLLNSVEANEKIEEEKERFLKVNVFNCEEKIYINIKNSWNPVDIDKIRTTKIDKENHGFGRKNVKNIVLKYNGIINYSINNKYVEVEVLI